MERACIKIDKEFEDIFPQFIETLHMDILNLKSAILLKNKRSLHDISHRAKGYCSSYGFHVLQLHFSNLLMYSKSENFIRARKSVEEIDNYVRKISIEYIPF